MSSVHFFVSPSILGTYREAAIQICNTLEIYPYNYVSVPVTEGSTATMAVERWMLVARDLYYQNVLQQTLLAMRTVMKD